jgi:hypothetical protein
MGVGGSRVRINDARRWPPVMPGVPRTYDATGTLRRSVTLVTALPIQMLMHGLDARVGRRGDDLGALAGVLLHACEYLGRGLGGCAAVEGRLRVVFDHELRGLRRSAVDEQLGQPDCHVDAA